MQKACCAKLTKNIVVSYPNAWYAWVVPRYVHLGKTGILLLVWNGILSYPMVHLIGMVSYCWMALIGWNMGWYCVYLSWGAGF